MLSTVVTAVVALAGVLLGGWVTTRNQNRLWQLDHARHWRDVRMRAFADFLAAYRAYLAYVLDPAAQITTRVNPNEQCSGLVDQLLGARDGRTFQGD